MCYRLLREILYLAISPFDFEVVTINEPSDQPKFRN